MENNNENDIKTEVTSDNSNQKQENSNTPNKKKHNSIVTKIIIIGVAMVVLAFFGLFLKIYFTLSNSIDKPVIYIYPEQETEVSVKLGYEDKITCIYPSYNNGWNVTAQPNGTLIDTKTNKKYYSLYYESDNTKNIMVI